VIVRDAGKQGLLLPSVWESIHDPLVFVRQLKLKAGLPVDHWSPSFEAFRFTAEYFDDSVAAAG
jgi:AMMECR1 domain-containing protein